MSGSGAASEAAISKEELLAQKLTKKQIDNAQAKILILSAYLDELENSIISREWSKVLVYAYTFTEQDNAFIVLIDKLFPSNDGLDTATRNALSYEAQQMFLAIDTLQEAAKSKDLLAAQKAYTKLALNYDHFLKAGNLYPTYDPITSTEIFFASTPLDSLQYDQKSVPKMFERVLIIKGPDMGKTGTLLLTETSESGSLTAVVKLDKNGGSFSEIKQTKLGNLGKLLEQTKEEEPLNVLMGGSSSSSSKQKEKNEKNLKSLR